MLYHKERLEMVSINVTSNTGPACISSDGKLLFLSNTYAGNSADKMGLFVLKKSINGWSILTEFPFNSSEYSVMHPAYDEENNRLFFSSNKESTNFNLWYVDFDGEAFGDSLYEMKDINAIDANDVFPYFYDGVLYYASDRKNYTFLNMYEAEIVGDKWDARTIQDSLFISPYDDFGLKMISDRTGFFTTTRHTDGKRDELIAFRKGVDCSSFPEFSNRKFIGDKDEQLREALVVIEEFRNVFGIESELSYQLNVDYIREKMNTSDISISDFYCDLFNEIDSTSLAGIDESLEQSLESERLVDSLYSAVSNDLQQEIIIDSLVQLIKDRYDDIGIDIELEEQRRALKEAYEPLRKLADSLVEFSDTLKKALVEKLNGFQIEDEKLPDFAKKPNGLFFAIQVGAYSKKANRDDFANLGEVIEVEGPTDLYHYVTGFCNSLDMALKSQAQVRGVGYPDAFIVAYCDGERIPIFRAKELIASGECEPLAESREPNIDYTVVINRKGTDKPFTVEVDPNYNKAEGAAKAVASETKEGLFFTVQIGVYDEPVKANVIHDMPDLITTLLPNGQIRYSSGMFISEEEGREHVNYAKNNGIEDAYMTAYYNGKRIPVFKARDLLKEKGEGILIEQ